MAYAPARDLEVVRHRERELAAARTRAEVDALDERWRTEDRALAEAADWRTKQVRDLTQRVARIEALLGPGGQHMAEGIARGIAKVLAQSRTQERERMMAEIEKRGYLSHKGIWDSGQAYPAGAVVTDHGSVWCAVARCEAGERPSKAPGWRLMAKGDAGKGVTVA